MGRGSDPSGTSEAAGDEMFRAASRAFLAGREAKDRKALGQYLTPAPVRARLLDRLQIEPGMRVLDPGAGTGEFLLDVIGRCPDAEVHGFDIDPEMVSICHGQGLTGVALRDVLTEGAGEGFDLVVGNPPYYEHRGDQTLATRFADVLSGRPNVFSMFFKVGLDALADGGRLAFVVPPSMNNGRFFLALRRYIVAHGDVEFLEVLDDPELFDGALQSVQLIVLRKGSKRRDRHVFHAPDDHDTVPLFMRDPDRMQRLLEGQETLHDLGMQIRTGRCVWNQHKAALRTERGPGIVPLIWSHNIRNGELVLDEGMVRKPQFVEFAGPDKGPAIVVNRIIGSVGRGTLRAALIPDGMEFVAENHVNVIQRSETPMFARASHDLWADVLTGLLSRRAEDAMRSITGNTQLSSRELSRWIPIVPRRATPRSMDQAQRREGMETGR